MPAITAARNAHIPHDATNSATLGENPGTVLPDLIELSQEGLIFFNVSQLTISVFIFLQRPIRRRGND
jgi:hypothetical protein